MSTHHSPTIEVCFTPDLFKYRQSSDPILIVVVDIFRAGSTVCAALSNGFQKVKPVSDLAEAEKLKRENGWPAAGERNGVKLPFTDYGNSPVALAGVKHSGVPLILTTSNGTKAIEVSKDAGDIIVGGFNNMGAISKWLLNQNKNVLILCSGWMGSMSLEDTVFAGALIEQINLKLLNDEAFMAQKLWSEAKNDLKGFLQQGTHFQRLLKLGAERDIDFALSIDNSNVIPIFKDGFLLNNL
ncbi:MAG TPA: 2-phosphosulfolactate phosphatase [Bacteroidales bacterium]|nr:2-phosphosulfolactate phosphatase [Bacteroidales bacterium]HRX97239.1 2-phosphosulfolactate phosphatase [Bacteroidales bacterium]